MAETIKRVPLTIDEAKNLNLHSQIWLEETGGYEGSSGYLEEVEVTDITDEAMFFRSTGPSFPEVPYLPWTGGRAWGGYNKKYCGWRLWHEKPTCEEFMAAKLDESWNEIWGRFVD